MKKTLVTVVCTTIGFLIFLSGKALSAVKVSDISIPASVGFVKETFQSPPDEKGKDRIILHIQDVHCNYEAQKNMAQLLEYLIKTYDLKLILVEGGKGNLNVSFLRGYADMRTRQEIADAYLKTGRISGEEYLDIVSNYNLDIFGVDDDDLYKAHLAAFWKVNAVKDEGMKYVAEISTAVKNLKDLLYNEELKMMEKKTSDYNSKILSLSAYCLFLNEKAKKKDIDLKTYPHLFNFSETACLEKDIDFKQAETERNAFVTELAQSLDENTLEILVNKTREFKEGKIAPVDYYEFLSRISEGKINSSSEYAQLHAYIRYLSISRDIDAQTLLDEVNAMEKTLKKKSMVSDNEIMLDGISESLRILNCFLNLEVTPEDYAYFTSNRDKFISTYWREFLSEKCRMNNCGTMVSDPSVIDSNLPLFEDFYRLGFAREKAFFKNAERKLTESGESMAVLITGGFHTPGIISLLKEDGYSYMVMAPVITREYDSAVYFTVLKDQDSGAEDYYEEEDAE